MSPRKNKKRRERRRQAKLNKESVEGNCNVKLGTICEKKVDEAVTTLADNLSGTKLIGTNLDDVTVSPASLEDEFYILGEGSFGLVTLGVFHHANGRKQKVALKAPTSKKYNKLFLQEAEVMINFDHKNVIKLVAFQKSPLKIAMEYMDRGDILDAIKRVPFTNLDIVKILHQIATGMEHIAQKQYVHLDLACRNVFVNSQKQAKIGDFGLCQYVGDTDGIFHLKGNVYHVFCAPEGRCYGRFTTKSDVWSMGLLIWDLYTTMSGEFSIFKKLFLETLSEFPDYRLPKPPRCPFNIYLYIRHLLNEDPNHRPTFTSVKEKLSTYLL